MVWKSYMGYGLNGVTSAPKRYNVQKVHENSRMHLKLPIYHTGDSCSSQTDISLHNEIVIFAPCRLQPSLHLSNLGYIVTVRLELVDSRALIRQCITKLPGITRECHVLAACRSLRPSILGIVEEALGD